MDTREGYTAYLAQLQRDLDALERFPLSSKVQALVLAVSATLMIGGFLGFTGMSAPLYLVLPFVVIPWWNLTRREMRYQRELRTATELMRSVERRLERAPLEDEGPGRDGRIIE